MSRSFGGTLFTTRSPMRISPAGDVLQPGDHAQQRGLAAAGGADQHDELAVGDRDVDAVDDLGGPEGLLDVADTDRRHTLPPVTAHALNVRCEATESSAVGRPKSMPAFGGIAQTRTVE